MRFGPKFFVRIIAVCVLFLTFYPKIVLSTNFTVYGPTDYYFTVDTLQKLEMRASAQSFGIDSTFWLYDTRDNSLVAYNDDYFGLDSYISYDVQPNVVYRLRAGVCCGDPDRWYGSFYFVELNYEPIDAPTTTTQESVITEVPTTITETTEVTTTTEQSVSTTTLYVEPSSPTTVPEVPTSTQTTTLPQTSTSVPSVVPSSSTTSSTLVEPPQSTTTFPTKITAVQTTIPLITTIPESTTTTTIVIPNASVTPVADYVSKELEQLDNSQLTEFFDKIDYDALSGTELNALVSVLNDQPSTVKKAFENSVNVFDGKFDQYVPNGSKITVKQRKAIIAVTGVLFVAPAVPSTSGSKSSENRNRRR